MLAAIEKELEDEAFVVVGVHSPKFPTERDEAAVREAVRRYGVTHPVVVDSGMRIWMEYGVNAWPTFALVDPRGYVVGAGSGEPDRDTLLRALRGVLDQGRADGTLEPKPLPLALEPPPPGSLSYPGKVIAGDAALIVADTGHHQIVVCDMTGVEQRRFGTGAPGMADGAEATFHHPNGLALDGERLYVADTGNHALREIDLSSGATRTVAGTGERGRGGSPGGPARLVALRSPWDLAWDGRRLFIAMAGTHQIWVFDPATETIAAFAGTGAERRMDGPVRSAAFAQPSGIVLLDGSLYIADSEISTIRAIDDLDGDPVARTVCGSGDLFGFGDQDGIGAAVLMQHPMGIAVSDGSLLVADTFNHKIRRVDPRTGECETLFGGGGAERLPEVVPGYELADARPEMPAFHEPEGLAWNGHDVIVADTNNHRVLAVAPDGSRHVLIGG